MPLDKKRKTYLLVVLALFVLIFFHYLGWTNWIENMARYILIPTSTKIYKAGDNAKKEYQEIFKKGELTANYQACLDKTRDIVFYQTKIDLLSKENDELRSQLDFTKKTKFKLVSSEVIGKNIEDTEQSLIINRGADHGLLEGMPVIVGEGTLIGKISKVEPETALVRLINDNQSKIASTILNESKSMGVVEGGYGLSLRMKLIPRNENILVGQKIITSGLESGMPKGLIIGEVSVVENEAYQPFQQAILTPSANLSHLNLVFVITGQ